MAEKFYGPWTLHCLLNKEGVGKLMKVVHEDRKCGVLVIKNMVSFANRHSLRIVPSNSKPNILRLLCYH